MSSSASQQALFSLLPRSRTPWAEFVFSTGTQAAAVAVLVWVRLMLPVVAPAEHNPRLVVLVNTPAPVNHQPQPVVKLSPMVRPLTIPVNTLRLPAAQPKLTAKVEDVPAPTVAIAPRKVEPVAAVAPVIPKQGVKMDTFATGSSATPTIARAASQVQTGGFGDPNGIPAKTGSGKPANIAALGSFDLPSGPGQGNGTAGAKGVAGVIASSGFGNGTAVGDAHPRTTQAVQSGGFASMDAPLQPSNRGHAAETAAKMVPAEILSKPAPIYTTEARSLRIEGEVLLEVVLQASGNLQVVRVVRGLGHGLDDNAVKAAEQIRFKPALKDGQPSDSTVVLHIIFQLA